jgi:hypothetical protein
MATTTSARPPGARAEGGAFGVAALGFEGLGVSVSVAIVVLQAVIEVGEELPLQTPNTIPDGALGQQHGHVHSQDGD